MTIKEKYDKFVAKNGCEPRYAEVSIVFTDDREHRIDGYIIAMVNDEETERLDNCIFYYCDSLSDLIAVTKDGGCMDFIVIEDSVEFTNNI